MHLLTLASGYTLYLRGAGRLVKEMPREVYFCFQAHVIPWERAALPESMQYFQLEQATTLSNVLIHS